MAATTSAATITAASSTTAESTPTTSAFARGLWTGFVHSDRASFKIGSIEFGDGVSGFLLRRHFNEPKTFAPAGIAIRNDRRGLYFARL
jgi:hypothetical protein